MTESTRRALRTGFQLLVALITITPILLGALKGTPVEASVAIFAAWVAIVAKLLNALEDSGLVPPWLKRGVAPVRRAPKPPKSE